MFPLKQAKAIGMEQGGTWVTPQGIEQKYKYNGKEHIGSGLGWYDYGARWYDPCVGRFSSVDPKAAELASISTFYYAFNNPIHFIDPDGRFPVPWPKMTWKNVKKATVDVLALTDINDARVLVTTVNRDGKGVNLDGSLANKSDKIAATAGIFLPIVSGSLVKNIVEGGVEIVSNIVKGSGGVESKLQKAANKASKIVGEGSWGAHGSKIHSEFVKNVSEIDGVTSEVSYKNGNVVPYGTSGSVRPDAVEGDITSPTNIYDLKTGKAKVEPKDVSKFQNHVPGSPIVKEIKPNGQ